MGTELSTSESYEVAKSVCLGIKCVITCFRKDGLIRKNEIKVLQEDLQTALAEKKINNTNQLFVLAMDKVDRFIKRYDLDNMSEVEAKIFYNQLDRLNDYLNNIIDSYSK